MADVSSSPKVYVVPDEQLNQQQLQQPIPRSQVRYGEEVPRQSWQQTTAALVDAIGSHRKANPVTIPFPAGTKTLAGKQFDYEKEQFEQEKERFEREWPYKEASYVYDLNKPYFAPSKSNEEEIEDTTASQLGPYLTQYKTYNDLIADLPLIAPHISTDAYKELQKMIEGAKDMYFDEYDQPITPRNFIPGQGSPLFRGLEDLGIYTRPKQKEDAISDDDLLEFLK
jgi:hypothetical protein